MAEKEELQLATNDIVARAEAVRIADSESYNNAAVFIKNIKAVTKQVEGYWKPIKASAHDTWKALCDSESQMLNPLKTAEKTLKNAMTAYTVEVERKRREQEEEIRRLAQEEAERKRIEAEKAEADGNMFDAEMARAEAEVMQSYSETATVEAEKPKASGVSQRKAWKIVGVDASKVPVDICGTVIRPVDERAVMALIKASKGTIQIPGITYEETVQIAVR